MVGSFVLTGELYEEEEDIVLSELNDEELVEQMRGL